MGAYGGKKEIMEMVSPLGGVYQAGTLSGNPIAMHLGAKSLNMLKENPQIYDELEEKAIYIEEGFKRNIEKTGAKAKIVRFKGMLTLFFGEGEFKNYDDVMKCDTNMYGKYFKKMLERGIMLPPAQFECIFLSAAHSEEDLEKLVKANLEALTEINN